MKNRRTLYLLATLSLLLLVGVQSCKTHKKIVTIAPIVDKVESRLFADIIDSHFDFNTFSSRINLKYSSGGRSLTSKSQLRIIKDQGIQLSVQPLFGVEMLRLYIDPDSLLLLDRMNKQYIKESLADVKEKYPVGFDFYTLQSLLMNRLFVAGIPHAGYDDYELFSKSQNCEMYYNLNAVDHRSGITYGFMVDGHDRITSTHLYEPQRKYKVNWEYDQFVIEESCIFPHWMNVMLHTPKKEINVGMEFSSIELNEPAQLNNSIPSSYTKADIQRLLNLITNI